MKTFLSILSYPFTWGLIVGLIFAGWALSAWWNAKRRWAAEKKEAATEKAGLENTIKSGNVILSDKIRELEKTLDELKKENEELRIKVQSLQNDPSRTEHMEFMQQKKAIALLQEHVFGFAQCWPKALRAAQHDGDKTNAEVAELERLFAPAAGLLPANSSEATGPNS